MKIKKKIVLIINVAMVLSTIFLIIIALIRKKFHCFHTSVFALHF